MPILVTPKPILLVLTASFSGFATVTLMVPVVLLVLIVLVVSVIPVVQFWWFCSEVLGFSTGHNAC